MSPEKLKCQQCSLAITDKDEVIKCYGYCNSYYHVGDCAQLKRGFSKTLSEKPNLQWYCNNCMSPNAMFKKLTDCYQSINELIVKLTPILEVIPTLVSSITAMNVQNSTKSFANIVKGNLNAYSTPISTPTSQRKRRRSPTTNRNNKPLYNVNLQYGTKPKESNNDELSSLAIAPPVNNESVDLKHVFITKFDRNTSAEQITNYIAKNIEDPSQIKVKKLVKRDVSIESLTFVSFKISAPTELFNQIVATSFLPDTVSVREFIDNKPAIVDGLTDITLVGSNNNANNTSETNIAKRANFHQENI